MTIHDEQSTGQLPSKISRRTLAAGAAWSVPVIAVASAAPAYALSGEPIKPSFTGVACKHPGNPKYYHFDLCLQNTSPDPITVYLDKMVINGQTGPTMFPTSILVGAGSTVCKDIDAGLFGNSANGQGELFFHYTFNGSQVDDTLITQINDLPVCGSPNAPDQPSGDPPHPGQ